VSPRSEVGRVVTGDNDDACLRMRGADGAGGGQAVHAWHVDVHQRPVRVMVLIGPQGIATVAALDHLGIARQEIAHRAAEPGVVVHQQEGLRRWY
jgi:hypothetical protein